MERKFIGVGIDRRRLDSVYTDICPCPADIVDRAKNLLTSDLISHVLIFELYGTVERSAAPVIFTPAKGAEPPGKLPEPPDTGQIDGF